METIKGLTYKIIEQALVQLGFTVRYDKKARVYQHPGGAFLALPPVDLNQEVLQRHLFSVTITVDNFELMDRHDFEFLLLKLSPSVSFTPQVAA